MKGGWRYDSNHGGLELSKNGGSGGGEAYIGFVPERQGLYSQPGPGGSLPDSALTEIPPWAGTGPVDWEQRTY